MQPVAEPVVVEVLLDLRLHTEKEVLSLTGLILRPVDVLEAPLHPVVDGVQFVWPYVRIAAEKKSNESV